MHNAHTDTSTARGSPDPFKLTFWATGVRAGEGLRAVSCELERNADVTASLLNQNPHFNKIPM